MTKACQEKLTRRAGRGFVTLIKVNMHVNDTNLLGFIIKANECSTSRVDQLSSE